MIEKEVDWPIPFLSLFGQACMQEIYLLSLVHSHDTGVMIICFAQSL